MQNFARHQLWVGGHKRERVRLAPLVLFIASTWFYVGVTVYSGNWYGVYHPRVLLVGAILIPLLFVLLMFFWEKAYIPASGNMTRKNILTLLGICILLGILLAWLFPPAVPAFYQPRTLRLVSTGQKNELSRGQKIEVKALRAIDGQPIQLSQLHLDGGWQYTNGQLVSGGEEMAVAEFTGNLAQGVELRLNYQPNGGKLFVQFDRRQQEFDLYNRWVVAGSVSLGDSPWSTGSQAEKAALVLGVVLYVVGLASLLFSLALIFELHLLPAWAVRLLLAATLAVIFLLYAGVKHSFANFNAERVYGDTLSYVQTAQIPLASSTFWLNPRSFSLPLFYKLGGMNLGNYTEIPQMRKVGNYQEWLSIFSWTALAVAVAGSLRKKWLAPLAFGLVLFFSLSVDITLWDRLMYSESLSFSLFALLLALWLGLGELEILWRNRGLGAGYLGVTLLVTILYSFTRDTNLYFVLTGAVIFGLAALFKRLPAGSQPLYLGYVAAVIGLFFVQNLTIRLGDRWQIHIFDNLVRRALVDEPDLLASFQQAGLPMSQKVWDLKGMGVAEYQGLLERSNLPEYQAVREWVNAKGQSTYILFLLTHPDRSLLDPVHHFDNLVNSNNSEYRYPIFPNQPVPGFILANDRKFYWRSGLSEFSFAALLVFGLAGYWLGRGRPRQAWGVLAILAASVFPLAFMVWNGNPLEIERHAAQIGMQIRLAGWMAFLLILDRAVEVKIKGIDL